MLIEYCEFPDNYFYDVENGIWLGKGNNAEPVRMGITSTLLFLAGGFTKIKLKTELNNVEFGMAIGTLESSTYFGAIRAPVSGRISKFNPSLKDNLNILNKSPYDEGWIAEFESINESTLSRLSYGENAKLGLEAKIKELKVRCFKMLPNSEINGIGLECTGTLRDLEEIFFSNPTGYVVHIVTDDPVAEIELRRWTNQTKNEYIEGRREKNLYHFLVRKTSG